MEHLFAGWRMAHPEGVGADGHPHANLSPEPGKTLFETIEQSGLDDDQTYVLGRNGSAFAVLNVYPYNPGHILVLPKRGVTEVLDLSSTEYRDLWDLVRVATQAVTEAFGPHGLNIGLNQGTAGGGSIPDHLHIHVVPRWSADTNFMTSAADTRILPMTLQDSWERVRAVWPDPIVSRT